MNCKNCDKKISDKKQFCNEFCKKAYELKQTMDPLEIQEMEKRPEIIVQDGRETLFGKRYRDCTFENFVCKTERQKQVKKEIAEITGEIKGGKIFAFIGFWGTGKDHMAAAMAHRLNTLSIIHTTVQKISREVRETHKKEGGKQQNVMDWYSQCDFLIINEVGVQSVTQFERNILHEIIDTHYRNMTSVLLISNIPDIKDFQKCIDEPGILRVWDRIDQVVIFDWKSYRK